MSWIERMVEERLARAARDGELDAGPLTGRPIPDLDRQRPPGWWADRFVRRERSHDRRVAADAELARRRAGFWRSVDGDELRARVVDANRRIVAINVDLVEADRIAPFDLTDVERRFRALRAGTHGAD